MKTRDLNLKVAVIALGLCAFLVQSAHAGYTLAGNYLLVGVGSDGSIINPTGTASTNGINVGGGYENIPGIIWNGAGTGFGGSYVNNDFVTPGTPFQEYSLGVNGQYGIASYVYGDTLNATTTQTGPLSTQTTGSFDGASYVQTLSYGVNSSIINFSVTITNTTDATLNAIAYSTGLDPDPDVYQYGSYNTLNSIIEPGVVEATGPDTTNSIVIQSLTAGASSDIVESGYWPAYDPYTLFTGDGITSDSNDAAIFDSWLIPSLAAGASTTISYNYIINATPVTSTSPILNGAPDLGNTLAMFGFVLAGLGAVRRKFKA